MAGLSHSEVFSPKHPSASPECSHTSRCVWPQECVLIPRMRRCLKPFSRHQKRVCCVYHSPFEVLWSPGKAKHSRGERVADGPRVQTPHWRRCSRATENTRCPEHTGPLPAPRECMSGFYLLLSARAFRRKQTIFSFKEYHLPFTASSFTDTKF